MTLWVCPCHAHSLMRPPASTRTLVLAKARREQYGQSSEPGRLLVEQLELAIEDLEKTQAEQETKAETAAPAAAQA